MAILLKPLINEKSTNLMKEDFYTFEVDKKASKGQIEKVVSKKFNVDVLSVKTINTRGKKKMQRQRRLYYTQPGVKKALVQLKKGQKITLFEQVLAEQENTDEAKVTTAESEGKKPEVKEKKGLFGRTKVRVEKTEDKQEAFAVQDKEKIAKQTDPKRPTKKSQKEGKK